MLRSSHRLIFLSTTCIVVWSGGYIRPQPFPQGTKQSYRVQDMSVTPLPIVNAAVNPHLSISPTTGTLGVTSFTESYSGFTHNGTITENVTYPNAGLTVYHITADASGNATVSFVLQSQSGNYSSYAIDDATGVHSNTITYEANAAVN